MTDVLISASELANLASKEPCVIIDTRNPDAYGAGHIPSAVNVHEIFTFLATSTPEGMHELKTKFADAFGKAGLSGKETAVIYEQSMNTGFGQSCRGYYLLTMLGYPKIKVLHGGVDAPAAPRLPGTQEGPKPAAASLSLRSPAVEHLPRAQKCRREGRADVFRIVERMVPGSVPADRGRPAHRGQADRKGGIKTACFFIAWPRSRGRAVNPHVRRFCLFGSAPPRGMGHVHLRRSV